MSLVFATTFFLFFVFFGGRGVLRHSAVQTDFEYEISGSLCPSVPQTPDRFLYFSYIAHTIVNKREAWPTNYLRVSLVSSAL